MAGNCSLKRTLLIVILGVCAICYGAKTLSSSVLRLKHIESQEAIEILKKLGIGESISKVKGVNAIIISDSSEELAKAKAIMKVADSADDFAFEQLPASGDDVISIVKRVEKSIKDVSVGTFSEPVFSSDKIKAVMGLSSGKLIIGSTPEMVKKIAAVISDVSAVEPAEEIAVEITEIEKAAVEIEEQYLQADAVEVIEVKSSEDEEELFDDLVLALEKAEIETAAVDKQEAQELAEVVEEEIEQPVEKEVVSKDDKGMFEAFLKQVQQDKVEAKEVEKAIEVEVKDKPVIALAEPFIPDGNEVLDLELPEKVDIINLLDLLGEYLQLDYIYDAAQIKGDIMLKIQGSITIKDLYSYVEAILKSKGFAMVRGRGNLVMIVKTADAINYDPMLVGKDRGVKAGNVFVTNVFELEHIDTAVGAKLLSDMKLGGVPVQIPEMGSLIVTDYAYRMQRIEDLLKLIDKPGEPKSISYRTIEYISVSSLIPKLEKLAKELDSVSIVASVKSAVTPAKAKSRRGKPTPKPTPAAAATNGKDTVFLEADDRTNRIIMIGLEDQIATVNGLIDSLDIEQQDLRKIRNYVIENVAAEDAMNKLAELGIASAGKGSAKKPVKPSKAGKTPAGAGATEDATEELVQIVLLEPTNSLLISGTVQQHEKIETILAYVDQVALESSTPYIVYPLENQDPEDLASILNEIVSKTIETKDEKGKIVKAPTIEKEDITIVPDAGTFSLIVYASRQNQEWIGKLIKRLDKRRPQVLINVSLVEISDSDAFEFDLNIVANAKDSVLGNVQLPPINAGAAANILEGRWDGSALQGFWTSDKIQVLLDTVESKGYGRVMAQPKILVNDNEPGVIRTTEITYFKEETQSYPGDGQTPVTTVEYKPYTAKIELSIKPNIGEGDLLRLEVQMIREDFRKQLLSPPDYSTSDVDSIVTVPDGSTIILGGLVKLDQTKNISKVPLLGDLPLIGGLFRSINNSNETTKLYVFVKANILRPDQAEGLGQLKRISDRNKDEFEKAEREFQEYESWPAIDSEPIDPERVLETK